jgi:D-serine deaminase-like pyridoxal phosphate-dependent protein
MDLDTPAVVVDRRIVESNLRRAQDYADRHGFKLRPHIKTHKLALFARRQLELGAVGITCQKIGEAEVMAEAGIGDIFIPYNILGAEKLERLWRLHQRLAVSVTADSAAAVEGYLRRFADEGHPLPVLVECDTGANRCGVQDPGAANELATFIDSKPGLRFAGLMTYPPRGRTRDVNAWLTEARDRITGSGLPVEIISNGGTPDFYAAANVAAATEHRPGTYIYSDRMQVGFGVGTIADCAFTVLATVVSMPTPTRMVLDAGSKALAADQCAAPGHGHIVEYPQAVVKSLSEEHAVVDLAECPARPKIGDKVRIVPNHVCVVTNLFDFVHLAEDGKVIARLPVRARGKMG